MSDRAKVVIFIVCAIEQMIYIAGSIWLIYWRGFSQWWSLLTATLIICSSPTLIILGLEKYTNGKKRD